MRFPSTKPKSNPGSRRSFLPGRGNSRRLKAAPNPSFSADFGVLGVVEYYGYRYYHTNLGRWLSRDPIGERGGLNRYAIVNNGLPSRLDLLGLVETYGLKGLPKEVDILTSYDDDMLKARLFSRATSPADGSSFNEKQRCMKKVTLTIGIEVENKGLPKDEQGPLSAAIAVVQLSLEATESGVSIGDINRVMDRNPAYQNNNGVTAAIKVISYGSGKCAKFEILGSAIRTTRDEVPKSNSYGYAVWTNKAITPAGHPGWDDDSLNNNARHLTSRMEICTRCCNKADLLNDSKL